MIVVDSSGWVEYFMAGPLGPIYRQHVLRPDIVVPTIIIYEVCKITRREVSDDAARRAAVRMKAATVAELHADLAADAAAISIQHRLPMADAIIYATALLYGAELVTSDAHLQGLPGVTYIAKT